MSEILKLGEETGNSFETDSVVDSLESMADRFDPESAKRLRALEKIEDNSETEHLAVLAEEQKELTPEEAAIEYLGLLDELSRDFTYPYYNNERQGKVHYAENITTELGLRYSKNPHYRWKGYASTEAGETDGTMLRIASADSILASEIGWKEEGEKIGDGYKKAEAEIAQLDKEYADKGFFGKVFGKRKYEKMRRKLVGNKSRMTYKLNGHNAKIAKELAISYNESGRYDYDGENCDFGQKRNEADNRRFFGYDDPERAQKVERAMELRKKYEAEWAKKK